MSAVFKRGNAEIQGNLTPMIDMAFLLIVFFVLVSRIVDRETVEMDLPSPESSVSEEAAQDQRVVINVLPALSGVGKVDGYRVGGMQFAADAGGLAAMTQHLTALYSRNPLININVRADRSTHYEHVEPVMQSISTAARRAGNVPSAARINLVVVQER